MFISGVSERFVYKLVNEEKLAQNSGTKISTPGKKRKRTKGKIEVDDFDIGVIKRKIHEFYSEKKEIPTIPKLLNTLRGDINFKGGRETLRNLLKKIGFRFKRTQSNRKVLCERNDVAAWRASYLQKIKDNERQNTKPVVYLDETYIHSSHSSGKCWQGPEEEGDLEPVSKGPRWIIVHAGGEEGFVKDGLLVFKSNTKSGDYHDEMNSNNFKKWLNEKLLPNLDRPSLIVMDNAPYHSICINRSPNSNYLKADMQKWLLEKGVEFSEQMTKPQLYELIKRHKPEPEYEVDKIIKENGHQILRLPPYHCDLNAIEMVWSSMKRKVAETNISKSSAQMPKLISDACSKITAAEWKKYCSHVQNLHEEYREKDAHLDEPFIIQFNSDSESDSSDSEDDMECDLVSSSIPGIRPLTMNHDDHTYCYKI